MDEKAMYMGFGSLQKLVINKTEQTLILSAAQNWLVPKTEDEMIEFLQKEKYFSKDDAQKAVNYLKQGNYLMKASYDKNDRYSRPALYYSLSGADPDLVQEKLSNKHVLIIGCGGIGNHISSALATAGIGKLTLIDFDTIEISNLTRQTLFTEKDEGKSKIEILKRELLKRNSTIQIDIIQKESGQKDDIFPKCDLAVVSADGNSVVSKFNSYAVKNNIPYINVGYIEDIAIWGPFVIPGKTGCIACAKLASNTPFEITSDEDKKKWEIIGKINERYQAPSIWATNTLASSLAVLDIIRYLGEFGEIMSINRRMGLWTHNLKLDFQECPPNKACSVCGGGV
jgi:hypothetical protein